MVVLGECDIMAYMEMKIAQDNTELIKQAAEVAARIGLEAVGLQAENYAKRKCPVDTGRLRNSITHTVKGMEVYIGTNVDYAPYVEYGTSKTKAQPFLKPAAQNHAGEYKKIFEYYLQNAEG